VQGLGVGFPRFGVRTLGARFPGNPQGAGLGVGFPGFGVSFPGFGVRFTGDGLNGLGLQGSGCRVRGLGFEQVQGWGVGV